MASLHTVLAAMQSQISAVTGALASPSVRVGIDWPSTKTLMQNVRGGTALVTVFDRHSARDTTRWPPLALSETVVNATLTATVSNSTIAGGGTQTIALGGSVTAGDAVSCVLGAPVPLPGPLSGSGGGALYGSGGGALSGNFVDSIQLPTWAAIVTGGATDTPASMATKLAAAVNADSILSTWVTASAAGSAVTLTSLLASATLKLASNVGNGAAQITEVGRRAREISVHIWARSIEDRDTVGDPIEAMLAQMEVGWGAYPQGLAFPDGTGGRVVVMNDFLLDDATPSDTYRRDFMLSVEYPVTVTDNLYAVLAQITQTQPGYAVPAD